MILLSSEEIRVAINQAYRQYYIGKDLDPDDYETACPDGVVDYNVYDIPVDVQVRIEQTAITRAQVQKFIEWSEGYCTEAGCRRLHCGRCWQNLERNLKEDNHDTTNC